MSFVVYTAVPSWSPTAQFPDGQRATIGGYVVDYSPTIPTLAEVLERMEPTQAQLTAAIDLLRQQMLTDQQWQDVRMSVPADVTNTTNVPADITGLSFAIGANEKWTIRLILFCNGSTAGMKFQMVGPAAPASVKMAADGNTTAVTARTLSMVAALSTLTAAFIVNATPFTGKVEITARIINGPTAGTLKFQFASTTNGQTNKVLAASFGKAERDG